MGLGETEFKLYRMGGFVTTPAPTEPKTRIKDMKQQNGILYRTAFAFQFDIFPVAGANGESSIYIQFSV